MIFCEKVYHYGPGAKNKYDNIDRLIPVWIVHVFLSYFVRLGVHVDRMFRLAAHVVLPDDAALLGYLKVRRLARVDWNKFAKSLIL